MRELIEEMLKVILLSDEVEYDEIKSGLFLLESVGTFLEELLVRLLLGPGSRGRESVSLQEIVTRIRLLSARNCRDLGLLFGALLVATGLCLRRQGGGGRGGTRGWRRRR